VACISLSSGSEEVWLTDIEGKYREKLTDFKDNRHYIEVLCRIMEKACWE